MLILTRKKNETICIGEEIEITVLEVNGDQVKIGVNAPREIEVHRKEVILRVLEQNRAAITNSVQGFDQLKMSKFKK